MPAPATVRVPCAFIVTVCRGRCAHYQASLMRRPEVRGVVRALIPSSELCMEFAMPGRVMISSTTRSIRTQRTTPPCKFPHTTFCMTSSCHNMCCSHFPTTLPRGRLDAEALGEPCAMVVGPNHHHTDHIPPPCIRGLFCSSNFGPRAWHTAAREFACMWA